jgi:hypothetical protein
MGIPELVAWGMFAVLIGWVGVVLLATFHQLDGETREASEKREREARGGRRR